MRRRTIHASLLAAFVLAVLSAPLRGGTLYVPLVVDEALGDHRITTEVRVTNDSDRARELSYVFLRAWFDGTLPDRETESVRLELAPHQSEILTDLVGPGVWGVLEVTADPEISITSRLVSDAEAETPRPGVEIPVLTSDNQVAADGTATLQGWRRDGGQVTDFYLLNLGHENARCEVELFRRQGAPITRQTVPVLPLGLQRFRDVLALVGEERRNEVSATVSCDQRFHAFALTVDPATAEMVHISPSGTGSSTLLPPGTVPDGPPPPAVQCPATAVFEKNGAFHRPQPGKETRIFNIPMAAGQVFTRLTVDVDFTPDDWGNPSDGNHSVFWFHRAQRWAGNVFGYVNVFGPDRNIAKISTNADLPAGDIEAFTEAAEFEKGITYHVRFVYDTGLRLMEAVFTVSTGTPFEEEIARVTGRTTANAIRTEEPGFFIYFGHRAGSPGPEVATFDWLYANLCVQLE